jgi:hypothetical protein
VAAPAHVDEWTGEDVTIAQIDRQLALLREAPDDDDIPDLRTSVMTLVGWVPDDWLSAAAQTLAGLAERHPSRTILMVPHPDSAEDRLDADVSVRCFPVAGHHVCSEVVQLWLRGRRALAPAG